MYRQDVPTIGSVACSSDPTAALRASVVLCPWPPSSLPTWPLLAALVGELPPVRRGRRCLPLHAVQRRQEVRRHFIPSHFLLRRARRSAAWLVNRRPRRPRRCAARSIPMPTPASGLCHAACLSSKTRTATRHAKPSGSSHARPSSVMRTVIPRAMKTPRCSRKLRGNFRANAPCGVAIATSIH